MIALNTLKPEIYSKTFKYVLRQNNVQFDIKFIG